MSTCIFPEISRDRRVSDITPELRCGNLHVHIAEIGKMKNH